MATSTIFRSIYVRNAGQCRKLVSALERAEEAHKKQPASVQEARTLSKEQIQKIFGNEQK